MTLPAGSTSLKHRSQSMSEDDLLEGIIGALHVGGWLWHHVRRSDLAIQLGTPGFPDIFAVKGRQVIALELKSSTGRMGPGQMEWLAELREAGVDARVVTPREYDATWRWLVGDRLIERQP